MRIQGRNSRNVKHDESDAIACCTKDKRIQRQSIDEAGGTFRAATNCRTRCEHAGRPSDTAPFELPACIGSMPLRWQCTPVQQKWRHVTVQRALRAPVQDRKLEYERNFESTFRQRSGRTPCVHPIQFPHLLHAQVNCLPDHAAGGGARAVTGVALWPRLKCL